MPVRIPPDPKAMWDAQRVSRKMVRQQQNPKPGFGSVLAMLTLLGGVGIISYNLLREDKDKGGDVPLGPPDDIEEGMAAYRDCTVFKVIDREKWNAYVADFNPTFEVEPENAENILAEVFATIFPDCTWPPTKAVTIDGMTWGQQVADYRDSLAKMGVGGIKA